MSNKSKSNETGEKKSLLKKLLEKLKKIAEHIKSPTLFEKYEEIQKSLNDMVEQNEISNEALEDLYSITAEMEGKLGGLEEQDEQQLEKCVDQLSERLEEAKSHYTEITNDICKALSDATGISYEDVCNLFSDKSNGQVFTAGTDTYFSLDSIGTFKANVALDKETQTAYVLFEETAIPENAKQIPLENNDAETTLIATLNKTFAEQHREAVPVTHEAENTEKAATPAPKPEKRKARPIKFRDKYKNGVENPTTHITSKLFEDNSFRLRDVNGNMLVVAKKLAGEYQTNLYHGTSPSMTINGASSEIGVWKSENGKISANFTMPNDPAVSALFHSPEMAEYLHSIGVPKGMMQQLSSNVSNGKSERVGKSDFEKVQKLFDTCRTTIGDTDASRNISLRHPAVGKGHTFINIKSNAIDSTLSIGFDKKGNPTTLNYKANANERFEPVYNLITNDFIGQKGMELFQTDKEFQNMVYFALDAMKKNDLLRINVAPSKKMEEVKRAGDTVSRSFQKKSRYEAMNLNRVGVMQEWYKASILMGVATTTGDTEMRNTALQIMQNVVEGHAENSKPFRDMAELMEKSEAYRREMTRFQADDLTMIFSQDCTKEMAGNKDNNMLFQEAVRNFSGKVGGTEAIKAIAEVQHSLQEQVKTDVQHSLQGQKKERSQQRKNREKTGSEERA